MTEEQSSELVRELRRIRFVLAGILLLLALHFAQVAIQFWAESHYQAPRVSQDFRDGRGNLRPNYNELTRQQNSPAATPGGTRAARAATPGE